MDTAAPNEIWYVFNISDMCSSKQPEYVMLKTLDTPCVKYVPEKVFEELRCKHSGLIDAVTDGLLSKECTPNEVVVQVMGEQWQDKTYELEAENKRLRQELAIREESEQEKCIEYLKQENIDWEDKYRSVVRENAKLHDALKALVAGVHHEICEGRVSHECKECAMSHSKGGCAMTDAMRFLSDDETYDLLVPANYREREL